MVEYQWRGAFESNEVETLHAEGFDRAPDWSWDWWRQVEHHSLGWVCARDGASKLVGWVNVAWDGGVHVDFEEHLRAFYLESCGFTSAPAGLIRL